MLNIKHKILTTIWRSADMEVVTYGKVNPVKMLKDGYELVSQELKTYVMSEEEFAQNAKEE